MLASWSQNLIDQGLLLFYFHDGGRELVVERNLREQPSDTRTSCGTNKVDSLENRSFIADTVLFGGRDLFNQPTLALVVNGDENLFTSESKLVTGHVQHLAAELRDNNRAIVGNPCLRKNCAT